MSNSPEHRVTVDRSFFTCGIDYAGPVPVKLNKSRGDVLLPILEVIPATTCIGRWRREQLKTGLVAEKTKLEWILIGRTPESENRHEVNMIAVNMISQEGTPFSKRGLRAFK
ncbi:hypothetical protein NPIL_314021 [Nephila pilipes]|uniref:Uncharacterized protein n=1 Tax=Nephila pilipes TaxID=299642 RepID=A0A8X6P992_NEPPI|nr:hypothetical protein NPIL_314021 [Nephila pilipes]